LNLGGCQIECIKSFIGVSLYMLINIAGIVSAALTVAIKETIVLD
jgi:hypothetical protein